MSGTNDPLDEFNEVSLRLHESLKSCRALISGYRELLAPEQDNQPPSENPVTGIDRSSEV